MTPQDRAFYREERLAYRGPWNLPVTSDNAAVLVGRLLKAVGEAHVTVIVVPGADFHQTHHDDRIEFIASDITPQVIVHEVAHVIQMREGGIHGPDHDADFWNLVALLAAILEEVL